MRTGHRVSHLPRAHASPRPGLPALGAVAKAPEQAPELATVAAVPGGQTIDP